MIRRFPLLALLVSGACTEVSTDPNTVVAVRFDGSPYPSIVALDSLRDSLGALQPLTATGLNYKGDAVSGAKFAFSSSDTNLRVLDDGNVFAIRLKTDGVPAKVFATAASLQSVPDSLYVVQRADSIKAVKTVDTALVFTPGEGASTAENSPTFQVFGDTAAGKPKALVNKWLLSLQLRYKGTTIATSDTSFAFTFERVGSGTNAVRRQTIVDTTENGIAGHRVFVRNLTQAEDSIYLIATIRQRKANTKPIQDSTLVIIRPAPPPSSSLRPK